MGLPLFQAPVESDISSKPALKNPADPATARSPIRRTDRRRVHEIRQHRLQLLHVLQGNDAAASDASSNERDRVPSAPRSRPAEVARPTARRSRYNHWADTAFGDEPVRESEERASSQPGQTERVSPPETSLPSIRGAEALFPDNATLFADTGLLRQVFDEYAEPARPWAASDSRSGSRERTAIRRSGRLPFPMHYRRQSSFDSTSPVPVHMRLGTTDANTDRNASASHRFRPSDAPYQSRIDRYRRIFGYYDESGNHYGSATQPERSAERERSYEGDLGGLGDRERSPEDDSAWDTLQSSITPDPRAPSVGSSFASTTVSAAESQATGNSSNTSITNPDDGTELPCDPVDQDVGSDNEDDLDADLRGSSYRRSTPYDRRRSLVDGAADANNSADEDGTDNLEWLSQMQSIVQGLAARQDIPDQWWAAVGLTRSMTQE